MFNRLFGNTPNPQPKPLAEAQDQAQPQAGAQPQATPTVAEPTQDAKVTLRIDLDDTVALTLTEEEKMRYRSSDDFRRRRAFVAALKDDTDIDNVKVKKSKKQKQRELFAAKEGDYTNPVIILILLDIQDMMNKYVANLAQTNPAQAAVFQESIEIINITLSIFAKSDTIMQKGAWSKSTYLSDLKKRAEKKSQDSGETVGMFQHLVQLVELVDKVKITLELVPLITELSLWLFGIYWNDAALLVDKKKLNELTDEPIKDLALINKKQVQVFPFVSWKDEYVCYRTYGFRLLDVTYNHFLVSKKLEAKCLACELENGIIRAPQSAEALPLKVEKQAEDFSISMVASSKPKMTDIVVRINTANFPNMSAVSVKRALVAMFKNPLGALLGYRISAPIEIVIKEFSEKLGIFVLSSEMREMLRGVKDSALKMLDGYKQKKSTTLNNLVWLMSAGTLDNKNFALVEEARKTITAEKDYEGIIAALTKLRKDTLLNKSTHIADDVTRFLLAQIQIIRDTEAATGPNFQFAEPYIITDGQNQKIQTIVFTIPDEHCQVAEVICKTLHSIAVNKIGYDLATCALEDDDDRIGFFKEEIEKHGFTITQEEDYSEFYERTKEVVLEYIDPVNLSRFNLAHHCPRGTLPGFIERFLEKTHAQRAEGLLNILTNPDISLADKILGTISIYTQVKDEKSTTLGPALKKFLIAYMEWLTPYIPRERSASELKLTQNSRSLGMK